MTNTTINSLLLSITALMLLMTVGSASAADAITLRANEPYTVYYTTNCATPAGPAESYSFVSGQAPVESPEDKQKNKDLKKKLLRKYDLDKDTLTIRVEHTQYGKLGRINLSFKKSISNDIKQSSANKLDRSLAKSIVKKIIEEEADLFGMIDLDELVETEYRVDELGFTVIALQRHINQLPVEFAFFRFFIRANGEISSVTANLFPSPPELYEAVKKETISEARAREIAESVLREVGYDVAANPYMREYIKTKKIAIPTPPYVLWKVESYWNIFINAFTGAVLEKHSNFRRAKGVR